VLNFIKNVFNRLWADFRTYWWLPVGLLIYYFVVQRFFTYSCPFYQFIGLPCAGCGMTRAVSFALTGQFARAFYLNPLAFVIILFVIYCLFYRYIKGTKIPKFAGIIITIAVLMLIFYLVRMYLYFPDRVPYVYNYGNVLEDHIPGYRDFMQRMLGF
jgi:hypothetical protein